MDDPDVRPTPEIRGGLERMGQKSVIGRFDTDPAIGVYGDELQATAWGLGRACQGDLEEADEKTADQ